MPHKYNIFISIFLHHCIHYKESDFGGDDTGKLLQATATDETAPNAMHLTSQKVGKATHELYILVSSRGLSADAGGTKLNIMPDW